MSALIATQPSTQSFAQSFTQSVTQPVTQSASQLLDGCDRLLPLSGQLGELLPRGGIRRGSTLRVAPSPGATSLLMCLLVEPIRSGSWAAVVNIPDFGAEAAAELGIPLDRLAFIPTPGDQWLEVTATLLDNLDVVAIRPPERCRSVDARRLAARARQRNSVLIIHPSPDSTRSNWPEPADIDLSATASEWSGLRAGHGRLRFRDLTVIATGRRLPGHHRVRLTVTQPAEDTAIRGSPLPLYRTPVR